MQQEGAHAGFGHMLGQQAIRNRAQLQPVKVDSLHRVDQPGLAVGVGIGGDVQHHQLTHQRGLGQRQHHRGFAAHRMTDDIGAATLGPDHLGKVAGKCRVAVVGIVEAVAMIAHVDRNDAPRLGQTPRQSAKVLARSEQPMCQKHGRLRRILSGHGHVQHHVRNLAKLAKRCQRR
ncbi:hypothetical protein D3C76_1231090 [compost metagenome]